MASVSLVYPVEFPRDALNHIGQRLMEKGCVVPGFLPPEVGLLDLDALTYGQLLDRLNYTLLIDRNIASRLAKVAREGRVVERDVPTTTAIELMAFSQFTDLMIEPSIAFHELASTQGNQIAHEELGWFRAADRPNPEAWLNVALGLTDKIDAGPSEALGTENLQFPLRRWQRNYVLCLKIAEIELSMHERSALDRLMAVLRWMEAEFYVAGPAMAYATLYFAPFGGRKGLFKSLRSKDRYRAREGVMSAAWDVTHLSDFSKRVNNPRKASDRIMFATADKKLAEIAQKILMSHDRELFLNGLREWWGDVQASQVIGHYWEVFQRAATKAEHERRSFSNEEIKVMIADGEKALLEADI